MKESPANCPLKGKKAVLLDAGITNVSYLVDDRIVLRIKGRDQDPFNDNGAEKKTITALRGWKKTERVLSFDAESGRKISLYIPDTHRGKMPPTRSEMRRAAGLIREFHALRLGLRHSFKPFKRLAYYRRRADRDVDPKLEREIIEEAREIYRRCPLVFSHNDLVNGNILFGKRGSYLLDFEYAGRNVLPFDLASYLSENNVRKKGDIVSFYLDYGDPRVKLEDVEKMMRFADLLWHYWADWRYKVTGKDVFRKIGEEKLAFLLAGRG